MHSTTYMTTWSPGHSLSAPKRLSHKDLPYTASHSSSNSSLSPGISPSLTAALNFPLSQGAGYFFNREVSVGELRGLGHIGEILEEDESPTRKMTSKSAELKAMSVAAFYESLKEVGKNRKSEAAVPANPSNPQSQLKPSPQLESVPIRRDWADYSSGSNFTPSQTQQFNWEILPEKSPEVRPTPRLPRPKPVPLSAPSAEEGKAPFQLQHPPKKVKRVKRGSFAEETVLSSRVHGTTKFYNLKKRFGFITQENDSSDVFVCEDDLVLSDVNYKKFKEEVAAGRKPRFEFSVKIYQEKAQEKKKAVDLVLLED